jgi:condensin complex subunit 1
MATILFTIPANRADLLSEVHSSYTVKNVIIPAEIISKLEEAQTSFKEEGPDFILENFDTYYSVLHHAETLRPDVVHKAYNHLYKAVKEVNNTIIFLLDDPDSLNEELKTKMVNVLKMLTYIYIQFVIYLEEKKRKNQDDLVGGKGKIKEKKGNSFSVDKVQALNALSSIIQTEINMFWEPPIVEHDYVALVAELCFALLHNQSIKQEKQILTEIFGVLGNLVKSYDYGKTFVPRLIRSIRMYEHVVHCVSDGIKMMVNQFNCQSLIHHFVKEATEWQVDETFQDVQGTRCCSIFLTELVETIPDLILPEVMYLNKYLAHESIPLRVAVLNVMTEIVLKMLTKHDLTEEEKESRDDLLEVIIEHIRDVSAVVRSKVIQNLTKLQKENAIPLAFQTEVLSKVNKHLYDKAAAVRKVAISSITMFLEHNPFGANVGIDRLWNMSWYLFVIFSCN